MRAAVSCGRGRAVGVTATRKVSAVGSGLTTGGAAVGEAARSTDDATVTRADIAVGCGSAAGEGLGSHPANATATNVTQVATSADDFSLALIYPVSRCSCPLPHPLRWSLGIYRPWCCNRCYQCCSHVQLVGPPIGYSPIFNSSLRRTTLSENPHTYSRSRILGLCNLSFARNRQGADIAAKARPALFHRVPRQPSKP